MATKKNRKTAKKKADDTAYEPTWSGVLKMSLILLVIVILLAIGLHFYPLPSTTTLSPNQQIGHMVIVSNSPIPAGIVAYVPIYLNNTRNTTTAPTIFINISRNKYLPYLAYNETAPNQQLSNIEFYYELDNSSYPSGWLGMFFYEKLNYAILMSNSSTIIAMVQLPSSISPNSNMTIYMGFKRD